MKILVTGGFGFIGSHTVVELINNGYEVIEENPTQLESYKTNTKLFDYFIGQTMKKTKGKANPALTAKLLKKQLEIYITK